jgi:GTP-binding protein LepA
LSAPKGDAAAPLKALLVDAWYDLYLGVVLWVVCAAHAISVVHSSKAEARTKVLLDAMKDKG